MFTWTAAEAENHGDNMQNQTETKPQFVATTVSSSKVIATVQSRTDQSEPFHTVILCRRTGKTTCTCRSYQTRQYCYHATSLRNACEGPTSACPITPTPQP